MKPPVVAHAVKPGRTNLRSWMCGMQAADSWMTLLRVVVTFFKDDPKFLHLINDCLICGAFHLELFELFVVSYYLGFCI